MVDETKLICCPAHKGIPDNETSASKAWNFTCRNKQSK